MFIALWKKDDVLMRTPRLKTVLESLTQSVIRRMAVIDEFVFYTKPGLVAAVLK